MRPTLRELLCEGSDQLAGAGITEAALDAKYLLLEAFQMDLTHYLMEQNRELSDEDTIKRAVAAYRALLKKRAERIPLQQLIGSTAFMGLEFMVDEHVLIPRQDTETLVERVLLDYQGKDPAVLDLCTGSGCIGISLAVLGGYSSVTASDISTEALCTAKANGRRLAENRVEFVCSDLFDGFQADENAGKAARQFDVIVSNPPYIPTEVIKGLEPEVRDHEPMLALDGKEDGLYFYRILAKEAVKYLNHGGTVYLEIGYDQGKAVSCLLSEAGFQNIEVIKDAPGLDRVVRGELR